MSSSIEKQPAWLPLLLLFIGFGCFTSTFAQRLPVFAESFESFDSNGSDQEEDGDMQRTREQLRQLLGHQLTSAVTPLTAAPLAVLNRRQPAIVAPRSGVEAALRFADPPDELESSEEESGDSETDTETETETDSQEPEMEPEPEPEPELQQEYNPYRDNFNDRNDDGSYVYGYSLPNGVRRWERGYFTGQKHSLIVEGFYAQPRHLSHGQGIEYELRCYRADSHGYHPLTEYLRVPPRVRRNELPNVRCFNFNR